MKLEDLRDVYLDKSGNPVVTKAKIKVDIINLCKRLYPEMVEQAKFMGCNAEDAEELAFSIVDKRLVANDITPWEYENLERILIENGVDLSI